MTDAATRRRLLRRGIAAHAVEESPSVEAGADVETLSDALAGRTPATAELAAEYER